MADRVRVKLENGGEATVSASFAASHSTYLTVLDKPSHHRGKVLRTKNPVLLKGAALDQALEEAGLPKSGKADEKRERLADNQLSATPAASETPNNPVGESDMSEEDSK